MAAGDRKLLPRLLQVARQRPPPLFRDGKARIDLTYVDDVVDAVLAALSAGSAAEGQIFNNLRWRGGAGAGHRRGGLRPGRRAATLAQNAAFCPQCWRPAGGDGGWAFCPANPNRR